MTMTVEELREYSGITPEQASDEELIEAFGDGLRAPPTMRDRENWHMATSECTYEVAHKIVDHAIKLLHDVSHENRIAMLSEALEDASDIADDMVAKKTDPRILALSEKDKEDEEMEDEWEYEEEVELLCRGWLEEALNEMRKRKAEEKKDAEEREAWMAACETRLPIALQLADNLTFVVNPLPATLEVDAQMAGVHPTEKALVAHIRDNLTNYKATLDELCQDMHHEGRRQIRNVLKARVYEQIMRGLSEQVGPTLSFPKKDAPVGAAA